MSDDVCELSDLPASMCSHCKGLDVKEEPEPAGFEARYASRCRVCGHMISAGDMIRVDGFNHSIHAECGVS